MEDLLRRGGRPGKGVVDGLAQPGGVLAPAGGTTVTVVIASSPDLVGRVENALGLAG